MIIGTMSEIEKKLDWLQLYRSRAIGVKKFFKLIEQFGSAEEALRMVNRDGLYSRKQAEEELAKVTKLGGEMLCSYEESYPALLKETYDYPPVISILGNKELLGRDMIAIVGARNSSIQSCKFTQEIASQLGAAGFVVVSGLARGIDTAAHQGALSAGTIAVIATGINKIYPRANTKLSHEIAEKGLVISEYAFDTEPLATNFPQRNRIVAGMSKGVLVVEANLRSGSLITARFALEQNREVFAVPGSPMDNRAEGTNHLIKQGAHVVTEAQDILNIIAPESKIMQQIAHDDESAEQPNLKYGDMLEMLSKVPIEIDELLRNCKIPENQLQDMLFDMEMEGIIVRSAGGKIALG
jgi:DNA processing protein